jgi:hypothetical protein
MASTRTIALAATGVLAIVAAAIIGASAGSGGGSRSADSSDPEAVGTTSSATLPAPATTSSSPPRARGTSTSAGTPSRTPAAGATGSAGDPSGAVSGAGIGIEALPTPAGDPTATDYSLPPVPTAKPAPLLGATLPEAAVAKGRLVRGFPAALAPPAGTAIETSSVSVASDVLQAALVATGGDPDAILFHYRGLLTARGFAEKKTQGTENAPAAAFRKGKDTITVSTADGKTYLIAHHRPKGA